MNVLAILDTMWGDRAGRAPRWFTINPRNRSGARLYRLNPTYASLLATNACPELTTSANHHGKPDVEWLRENLKRLQASRQIDLILVCGAVAGKALINIEVDPKKLIYMSHPAARNWSFAREAEFREMIRKRLS